MQKCSQGSNHIVQQGDDDPSYLQEDGDRYTFQRYNKRFLVWEHHMQWRPGWRMVQKGRKEGNRGVSMPSYRILLLGHQKKGFKTSPIRPPLDIIIKVMEIRNFLWKNWIALKKQHFHSDNEGPADHAIIQCEIHQTTGSPVHINYQHFNDVFIFHS